MHLAANSSTCRVVRPGRMNAATSSKTIPATAHAGRISFKSSALLRIIPATKYQNRPRKRPFFKNPS
jgi:hypothetical protein